MLVGYARVSTQDQKPNLQTDALKSARCEKIFEEKASGAQRDRPELKAALDYIRVGDTLVVWKLDRLARSLKQLIETIEDMEDRGIGFKALTENIDTTTSGGKLVFHIFASLAEFERSIIRERTQAGLDAARARGKRCSRRLNVALSTLYRHIPGAGEHCKEEAYFLPSKTRSNIGTMLFLMCLLSSFHFTSDWSALCFR